MWQASPFTPHQSVQSIRSNSIQQQLGATCICHPTEVRLRKSDSPLGWASRTTSSFYAAWRMLPAGGGGEGGGVWGQGGHGQGEVFETSMSFFWSRRHPARLFTFFLAHKHKARLSLFELVGCIGWSGWALASEGSKKARRLSTFLARFVTATSSFTECSAVFVGCRVAFVSLAHWAGLQIQPHFLSKSLAAEPPV